MIRNACLVVLPIEMNNFIKPRDSNKLKRKTKEAKAKADAVNKQIKKREYLMCLFLGQEFAHEPVDAEI